jgi:anaerobic ribonucleoside-triphosphate reductase
MADMRRDDERTRTGFSVLAINFAVCACCGTHNDRPLATEIVKCRTCGAFCSCAGCVAEDDA